MAGAPVDCLLRFGAIVKRTYSPEDAIHLHAKDAR